MAPGHRTVTFLSDFGADDEFVGVVKSVIRSLSPDAVVVDLTHGIPPHDVRAGAMALARAVQYVAPGVIMAVVDPGVGTDRRAVGVEVADGEAVFLGPDNGLLGPAVAMTGGAGRAVWLNDTSHHLESPGPLFDGRDVFAPVAAKLCQGVPLEELGELVEPAGLFPAVFPLSEVGDDGVLRAEVLWVDRYGNAQLNVDPDELAPFGEKVALRIGGSVRSASWASSYDAIRPGAVGLVVDAYGLASVCVARSSAAAELGVTTGDTVTIEPGAGSDAGGVVSPVTLGTRRPGAGS